MIGFRKLSVYVGVLAVTCMFMGTQAFGGPGDIWGMITGEVEVDSLNTGVPGASETGSTLDSVIGAHGVSNQYWVAYSASLGNSHYNVTCGSNADEQEVIDFSMSSTTIIDWSTVDYDAEYELLNSTGGSSTTAVHLKYRFTSVGDSHSISHLSVKKNGIEVLNIQVGTDEVVVKDGSGAILESFDPNQNYYNHNFLYEKTFQLPSFSTGDTLRLTGNIGTVATEDGSDLSTLDIDVSTIGPT